MIYFIKEFHGGNIKIGFTKNEKTAKWRLGQCVVFCPYDVALIGLIEGSREREQEIHRKFSCYRIKGEWFKPCPEIEQIAKTGERLVGANHRLSEKEVEDFLKVAERNPLHKSSVILRVIYYGGIKPKDLWKTNPLELDIPNDLKKQWLEINPIPVSDRQLRRMWDEYRPFGCNKTLVGLSVSKHNKIQLSGISV